MEEIVDHIQGNHKKELSDHPISTLVSWSVVQCMGIKSCPLCSSCGPQDSPELVDHVLRHSYEFSLRALPWPRHISHDLNKPIGTYNPPEEKEAAERLGRWIREAESGSSEQLEISKFDQGDHITPISADPTDDTDYFAENDYFRDQSVDATSRRPEIQSIPSLSMIRSSEDEVIPSVGFKMPLPFTNTSALSDNQQKSTLGINVLYESAENADVEFVVRIYKRKGSC